MDAIRSVDDNSAIYEQEIPEHYCSTIHRSELSNNLSKLGLEVHAMSYTDKKLEGIITHPIKVRRENIIALLLYRILYILKLIKINITNDFNIVYTRNYESIGVVGILVRMIRRSKLVFEINGIRELDRKLRYGEGGAIKNIRIALANRMDILFIKRADALIAVTPEIKEILIGKGIDKNKITIIPNGANIDLFRPIDDFIAINKLRYQLNIDKNDNVLIFVGNLAIWQGVEYLIKSAPLILKAIPNTKFVIVGEGETKKELMKLTEKERLFDKFIFMGFVPHEKIPLYINMGDACVVTKKVLGYGYSPLKLYEYMACGKPVIATNTEGFEILEQYNAGILVNPENPHELSNAIVKLLQNEQLRKQMGANGRKLVVSEYAWESTAKKTIEVFRNLLK